MSRLMAAFYVAEDGPLVHSLATLLPFAADLVVETILSSTLVAKVKVESIDFQLKKQCWVQTCLEKLENYQNQERTDTQHQNKTN